MGLWTLDPSMFTPMAAREHPTPDWDLPHSPSYQGPGDSVSQINSWWQMRFQHSCVGYANWKNAKRRIGPKLESSSRRSTPKAARPRTFSSKVIRLKSADKTSAGIRRGYA